MSRHVTATFTRDSETDVLTIRVYDVDTNEELCWFEASRSLLAHLVLRALEDEIK